LGGHRPAVRGGVCVHERRTIIAVGATCERPPKMRYNQRGKRTPSTTSWSPSLREGGYYSFRLFAAQKAHLNVRLSPHYRSLLRKLASKREAITPSDFLLRKKLTSTFGFRLTFAVCFANSPQRGRLCGRPQVAPTVSSGANTLRRATSPRVGGYPLRHGFAAL